MTNMHILNLLLGLKAHKEKEMVLLRFEFVRYQAQFYNMAIMSDVIARSDQQRAILAGKYDDHIQENKDKIINYNNQINEI